MRKLKLQVQITLDGYISGLNGEADWMTFNWSDDIKKYVDEITQPVDLILLGRNLAAGFIPHWAAVAQDEKNPEREAGIKYSDPKPQHHNAGSNPETNLINFHVLISLTDTSAIQCHIETGWFWLFPISACS